MAKKKIFRTLARNKHKGLEIREYPPQRRTIKVGQKFYSLPFPWMIFAKMQRYEDAIFSVALVKRKIKSIYDLVYFSPLPHTEEDWAMCLGGVYYQENNISEMIDDFWRTRFRKGHETYYSGLALRYNFGDRWKNWESMEIKEAIKAIKYYPVTLEEFCLINYQQNIRWKAPIETIKTSAIKKRLDKISRKREKSDFLHPEPDLRVSALRELREQATPPATAWRST